MYILCFQVYLSTSAPRIELPPRCKVLWLWCCVLYAYTRGVVVMVGRLRFADYVYAARVHHHVLRLYVCGPHGCQTKTSQVRLCDAVRHAWIQPDTALSDLPTHAAATRNSQSLMRRLFINNRPPSTFSSWSRYTIKKGRQMGMVGRLNVEPCEYIWDAFKMMIPIIQKTKFSLEHVIKGEYCICVKDTMCGRCKNGFL